MKIWILDTETTGLPVRIGYNTYYDYRKLNKYNSSRVIQIGILEYNELHEKTNTYEFIIKPDDYKINNEEFHGITNERANREGISISDFVNELKSSFTSVDLLVAHNALFDRNVLASELWRAGLHQEATNFMNIPNFCTSYGTKHLLKIPLPYGGGYKQPRLVELYRCIFNKAPPNNMHNAMVDCEVLSQCFFYLLSNGKITLPNASKKQRINQRKKKR